MPKVTVLLAGLPPLLEDIIAHLLQARSGVAIIHGILSKAGLADAAFAAQADVIVVSHEEPWNLSALDERLAHLAALSVVALKPDGSSACVHTLNPTSTLLESVSGSEMQDLLSQGSERGGS